MIDKDQQVCTCDVEQAEPGRSSHWQKHLQHESWKSNTFGAKHGLGMFIPRTMRRVLINYLLQTPFRRCGRRFKTFPDVLAAGRRFAKIQNRVLDLDELRQVLSVACVQNYIDLQPSTPYIFTVIGDGYGRLANLLLAMFPECTVVLVNLSPALQIDLVSLKFGWPDLQVFEPECTEDLRLFLRTQRARVIAIPSTKAEILNALPIDGAFNVSSMQEMDIRVIAHYFELLRSNPASSTWFYCSNAIEKSWADGSIVRFANYPWDLQDEVLLDELCPWAQRGYQIFPPKYLRRPFPIQHRLVHLHKTNL